MSNLSSVIKILAVVISVGGLTVGCGSKVNIKEIQDKAQASFEEQKADLISSKDEFQQELDEKKSQLSEKDNKITELEQGLAAISEEDATEEETEEETEE